MSVLMDRLVRERDILRITAHLRCARVSVGKRPIVHGWLPRVSNEGEISIGDRLVVRGQESRALLETAQSGRIRVGDNALLNSGSYLHASARIDIGNNFRLAAFASVSDTDFHEVQPGSGVRTLPVVVGDDVWIGRAAIVLPGVHLGDGCVVGAGAVVTKSFPAGSVIAGVPAKVHRTIPYDPGRWRR